MNTNIELIEKLLYMVHQKEIPLEDAILKVSKEVNYKISYNLNIIRNYLVENDLIVHNPRVTFLNQSLDSQNGVEFIGDAIHPDFINDKITEKCTKLIENNELRNYLEINEI